MKEMTTQVLIRMTPELKDKIYQLRAKEEYRKESFGELARRMIIIGLKQEGIISEDEGA